MLKTLRAFDPTLRYFVKAQYYQWRFKSFPKDLRDDYLMAWAKETLKGMGVTFAATGHAPMPGPGLFLGNHISYLDVPLLCAHVPVLFVAKAEISKWPVFGKAGRLLNTIYVERSSRDSRQKTALAIANTILREEERVAIFPAGTTSLREEKMWRQGAFRIAQEHGIPVQAFRLTYTPERLAAFIDQDVFLPHVYRLCQQRSISAKIEFAKPRLVTHFEQDMQEIQAWCADHQRRQTAQCSNEAFAF